MGTARDPNLPHPQAVIEEVVSHYGGPSVWSSRPAPCTPCLGRLPVRDSFGSKDIGDRCVTITNGCADIGSVLPSKVRTGRIRTTTTIGKAGSGTKDIWDQEDHENGHWRHHHHDDDDQGNDD